MMAPRAIEIGGLKKVEEISLLAPLSQPKW
jgi:hypothetical protein